MTFIMRPYDDYVSNIPNFLGNVYTLKNIEQYECILGIGDNKQRYEVYKKLKNIYPTIVFTNAIHKNTFIASSVCIGMGNVICSGVSICSEVILGNHTIINTNSSIDHHCRLHDFIHVAPNCGVCGKVEIYAGSFLGVGSNVIPNIKIKPWSFHKAHSLIKENTGVIKIYEPYLKDCSTSIQDAIQTGWISSQGSYISKATNLLKSILHVKHVLLVSNGTTATHCLFMALKYKYPNISKIYVPNNVYVAAINSVLMEYPISMLEIMPIDIHTMNMRTDEEYILGCEQNSAILIVHNVGNIINVPRLKRLRPDIVFLEDNCEGLFGMYENYYAGTQSLCSSTSFFANKTITSGEGGAILTNDDDLYQYLSRKINQGNTSTRYLHDMLAYNYRMTNLQAALLYDQLHYP